MLSSTGFLTMLLPTRCRTCASCFPKPMQQHYASRATILKTVIRAGEVGEVTLTYVVPGNMAVLTAIRTDLGSFPSQVCLHLGCGVWWPRSRPADFGRELRRTPKIRTSPRRRSLTPSPSGQRRRVALHPRAWAWRGARRGAGSVESEGMVESRQLSAPTLLKAALRYAGRGVPVFPCEPDAKRPLTRNGHWDAT